MGNKGINMVMSIRSSKVTQAGEPASGSEVTPTMTPEADPRNELGSSTWGAVFDDDTETWFQYENEQVKSEVRDDKLVLTAKKANLRCLGDVLSTI